MSNFTHKHCLHETGNCLARSRSGKIQRKRRQEEELEQRRHPAVSLELSAVIVRRVVADDCLNEFALKQFRKISCLMLGRPLNIEKRGAVMKILVHAKL